MKAYVGIDLGSTTTKAVVLDEDGSVLGRGITNSRSNYTLACEVALGEALIAARFGLLDRELSAAGMPEADRSRRLAALELRFRRQQYLALLEVFRRVAARITASDLLARDVAGTVDGMLDRMAGEATVLFAEGAIRKSDFFRDLAGSRFLQLAEEASRDGGAPFDRLVGVFDKAILEVENTPSGAEDFGTHARAAVEDVDGAP